MSGAPRASWEERLPPKEWDEHPCFQEMVRKNHRLISWVDRRLRRRFDPYNRHRWESGYFTSFLLDLFNRLLYSYDQERSKLGHYLDLLAHRHVVEEFLQYESEAWHEFLDQRACNSADVRETNVNFAYYECEFHLYRVPEKDDDWARDMLEFFPSPADALEYLLGDLRVREKSILLRRFIHGHTLKEIAHDEKIAKQRVQQIQDRALDRIRWKILEAEDFRDYLTRVLRHPLPVVGNRYDWRGLKFGKPRRIWRKADLARV